MSRLMTLMFPSLVAGNDDVLFPSKDNSDASVESNVVSKSDNESESSIDQDSRVLFNDKLKWARGHRDEQIVGPIDIGFRTQRQIADEVANICYISQIEHKNIKDALTD
ncbi:hypothetical protein ACFX2J_013127 [Malus domestica]